MSDGYLYNFTEHLGMSGGPTELHAGGNHTTKNQRLPTDPLPRRRRARGGRRRRGKDGDAAGDLGFVDLAVGIPVEASELDLGVGEVAVGEAARDGVRRHGGLGSEVGIQDFGDGISMCGRTRRRNLGLRSRSRSETIGGGEGAVGGRRRGFVRRREISSGRSVWHVRCSVRFRGFTQVGVVASVRYTCTRTETLLCILTGRE
ncbi:hypothetical protein BHE74_00002902 [Ensete ventricosum]|nr:hypothetical protein BHE74_00002902 [Ensete ventricosum]